MLYMRGNEISVPDVEQRNKLVDIHNYLSYNVPYTPYMERYSFQEIKMRTRRHKHILITLMCGS